MTEPDSAQLTFVVDTEMAGERLDQMLAGVAGVPRSRLDVTSVEVDGRPARLKDRPSLDSVVCAVVLDRAAPPPEAEVVDLRVAYEDEYLAVVDKAAGVAVHPPRGQPLRPGTLVNALLGRYPEVAALADEETRNRPGIVHRLDRDTSGLLVVARTQVALDGLRELVAERALHREYAALVAGTFAVPSGAVDAPIGRRPGSQRLSVEHDGREALTRFRVEAAWARPEATAVTLWLETGRTHQIRVHMTAIGHPVVGDRHYGGRMVLGAKRQVLHSHRLAFPHPVTGATVDVVSPLPEDLRVVLLRAGPPTAGQVPVAWLEARALPHERASSGEA